jgi:hypothetical protein
LIDDKAFPIDGDGDQLRASHGEPPAAADSPVLQRLPKVFPGVTSIRAIGRRGLLGAGGDDNIVALQATSRK